MSKNDKNGKSKKHVIIRIPESEKSNPDVKKMMELHNQLMAGDLKEVSGTGMPMCKLSGAAAYCAKNANLGGGTRRNGGGGMVEGARRLQEYHGLLDRLVERYMPENDTRRVIGNPESGNKIITAQRKTGRVIANPDPSSGTIPPADK